MRITTTGRAKRYAIYDGNTVVATGQLSGTDYLASALTVEADTDENAFVATLPAAQFDDLPDSGWLEEGDIYNHEGSAVIVRQSHRRTEHDPADVPALFLVYRENAGDVLEWVEGESVILGVHRMFEGTEYECLQGHVTQSDWTPPQVLGTLWAAVAGADEWVYGETGVEVGDLRTYEGVTYECIQNPGINIWPPPTVPALWQEVA